MVAVIKNDAAFQILIRLASLLLLLILQLLPILHGLSMVSHHHHHHRPTLHIAVTREMGKNDKLRQAIRRRLPTNNDHNNDQNNDVIIHELPCIEHAVGPDYDRLEQSLYDRPGCWDYVIVTSPEAATVLGQVWHSDDITTTAATTAVSSSSSNDGGIPQPLAVAAVGAATATQLQQLGIPVAFVPSRATAVDLARELPFSSSSSSSSSSASTSDDSDSGQRRPRVLYVASAQAPATLERGLAERNVVTERLNTYDTIQASWNSTAQTIAGQCSIVCYASPSAVKGWIGNTNHRPAIAVCIGHTTAEACTQLGGFHVIRYPDHPGMDGWVQLVHEAVVELQQHQQQQEIQNV